MYVFTSMLRNVFHFGSIIWHMHFAVPLYLNSCLGPRGCVKKPFPLEVPNLLHYLVLSLATNKRGGACV